MARRISDYELAWIHLPITFYAFLVLPNAKFAEKNPQLLIETRPQFAKTTFGLLGLFLAGLLASVMSSCDAFIVATSGLFTKTL